MVNEIFVSASKKDDNLINGLGEVISRTRLKMITEYFEDLKPPACNEIMKDIEKSKFFVVLLGPNAQDFLHTRDWIQWEIGVASAKRKDIWVFEDTSTQISMVIPHLTDYVIWDINNPEHKKSIRDIIEDKYETHFENKDVKNQKAFASGVYLGNKITSAIKNTHHSYSESKPDMMYLITNKKFDISERKRRNILCENCKQNFRLWSNINAFLCPTCRKKITL